MFTEMFSAAKTKTVEKDGFAMFAPIWTDSNAKEGHVFYHSYDRAIAGLSDDDKARTMHAMTLATEDVRNVGGPSNFRPTWVIVITWENVLPRMSYDQENDKVMYYTSMYYFH